MSATRDGVSLDIVWLLMDATHPSYAGRLTSLENKHKQSGTYELSVVLSPNTEQSFIKVAGADMAWLSGFRQNAETVYGHADRAAAYTLVSGWDLQRAASDV